MNKIIETLRIESNEWINKLSPNEKYAIKKYSYNSHESGNKKFFFRLNAFLRKDYMGNDTDMLAEYSELISSAISKYQLKQDLICYRKVDFVAKNLLVVGNIISFDQFISTSIFKNSCLRKEILMKIHVPKGSVGAYIELLSSYPEQYEFLLDKNCRYRIIKSEPKYIELEVVNHD